MSYPDQKTLNRLLKYDPLTGKLFWKRQERRFFDSDRVWKIWNTKYADKEAFTAQDKDGYHRGSINYVSYLAHRVIFKYLHGYDPDQVEHDDRDTSNNRPHNLIDASATDNSRNCKLYVSNSSGYVGVTRDTARGMWRAEIMVGGRHIHLGRFEDINDAITSRERAERRHGFHPNHGK